MSLPVLLTLLALAASEPPQRSTERGMEQMLRGEFDAAIASFDEAVRFSRDDAQLAALHLRRGECFAAQRDFARAEGAFAQALEHDPEARLDPATVNPSVVQLLDSLRQRLSGMLDVQTDPTPLQLALDGKPLGASPLQTKPPIGTHRLTATDGARSISQDVQVRPGRVARASLQLSPPVSEVSARAKTLHTQPQLTAELRLMVDVPRGVAPEAALGARGRVWMASLGVTLGTGVGLTLRAGARAAELLGPVGLHGTVDGVVFFPETQPSFGGGLTAGINVQLLWGLELLCELSGRVFQARESFRSAYLLPSLGIRGGWGW